MKRVLFVLAAMFLMGMPAVFAQQEVNQTTTTTTTTTTGTPVTMTVPESVNPWEISVQDGALWSLKNKSRLHGGNEVTGRLTYDVTPNVALGGESGGMRFEDERNGTKFGRLYGVPAMADLVLKMPIAATGNRLVPYVYGGAGVIFWSYSKSTFSDDTGVDARRATHFAAKPGGGLEYHLTPNVSLFVEASYLFSRKYELKNGSSTPPNGKINVDSLYGGGGLSLSF